MTKRGVLCPNCGNVASDVLYTRDVKKDNSNVRRRNCSSCDTRFTTYEKIDYSTISSINNDGEWEKFMRPQKTYLPDNNQISILVGGSNQKGNDKAKESAIALFREHEFLVHHTCEIYQSWIKAGYTKLVANRQVLKCLSACDYYYVVASNQGYTGMATASKFSYASFACPGLKIITSHELADEDLRFYISDTCLPENFAAKILSTNRN